MNYTHNLKIDKVYKVKLQAYDLHGSFTSKLVRFRFMRDRHKAVAIFKNGVSLLMWGYNPNYGDDYGWFATELPNHPDSGPEWFEVGKTKTPTGRTRRSS